MAKKFTILAGILFVVVAAAVYLRFFGRTMSKSENPLAKYKVEKINRFSLEFAGNSFEFEKTPAGWFVTKPLRDNADEKYVDEITTAMQSVTIGNPISENPSKHEQFEVNKERGVHMQVFVEGETKPALDAIIGKMADTYGKSYFRFEGKTPVFIANGIADFYLRRELKGMRSKKMLPNLADVESLMISHEKTNLDLVRSSATWTRRNSSNVIAASVMQGLIEKLDGLSAVDFVKPEGPTETDGYGFAKPFLHVTAVISGRTASFVVGTKSPRKNPEDEAAVYRFAKIDGRDAILIVREDSVTEIIKDLKTLAK